MSFVTSIESSYGTLEEISTKMIVSKVFTHVLLKMYLLVH